MTLIAVVGTVVSLGVVWAAIDRIDRHRSARFTDTQTEMWRKAANSSSGIGTTGGG